MYTHYMYYKQNIQPKCIWILAPVSERHVSLRFTLVCWVSVGNPAGEDLGGPGELHAEARGEHHRHPRGGGGPLGEGAQGAEPDLHFTLSFTLIAPF